MRRTVGLILLLGCFAVGSAQTAAAAGGQLTPAHRAQVTRFVDDARGVETHLDNYSAVWKLISDAQTGCTHAVSRPSFAAEVRQSAQHMIGYVKTAERGEVKLYAYSKDLSHASDKRQYVDALDAVGKDFDGQLRDGREGLKIAGLIAAGKCGEASIDAVGVSQDWTRHLKETRSDISKLQLAWGV